MDDLSGVRHWDAVAEKKLHATLKYLSPTQTSFVFKDDAFEGRLLRPADRLSIPVYK